MSLEKFVSSELEGALEEVSSGRRAEARQQSSRSFLGYDLSETSNHAFVLGERVELHPGLNAVSRRGLVSKLYCRYVQNLLILAHRRHLYPRLVYKQTDVNSEDCTWDLHINWSETAMSY